VIAGAGVEGLRRRLWPHHRRGGSRGFPVPALFAWCSGTGADLQRVRLRPHHRRPDRARAGSGRPCRCWWAKPPGRLRRCWRCDPAGRGVEGLRRRLWRHHRRGDRGAARLRRCSPGAAGPARICKGVRCRRVDPSGPGRRGLQASAVASPPPGRIEGRSGSGAVHLVQRDRRGSATGPALASPPPGGSRRGPWAGASGGLIAPGRGLGGFAGAGGVISRARR
jgi:hypothetical protein